MISVLGGLGAALAFTVSIMVSARASRLIGASSTVAGAMAVGLAIGLPVALASAPVPELTPDALGWSALAGVCNVVGLLLTYTAYRIGAVGIISTIASTEGAIAALFAVLAGEALQPGSGPVLGVIALGVAMAATGGHEEEEGREITRSQAARAAALTLCASVMFGLGLFAAGRVSELLPGAWPILPARVTGVLLVTIPLGLAGRIRMTRAAAPFVVATGVAEIVGFGAYAIGARDSIAVTSVLTAMFAPFATVAAFVFFRERLGRREILGIVLVASGVIGLGVLQR
jgi:drug/metabolite transporter (DMT)-like permease